MRTVGRWLVASASAWAMSAVAAPASAQVAASGADDKASANEMVVTAQFREQSLQDTPLAITAVSSERLVVSNLFDNFYYLARQENIANFGNAQDIVGRPREWLVGVKKSF